MEREVKIYIGNAAKFKEENLYTIPGYVVTDAGEIYVNGTKLKEYMRDGYKYVFLPINGKEKLCKVHRIVATSYQDICGEFNEVVNHLDENKLNNAASNLRWTTNKENLRWGTIEERRRKTIERKRILRLAKQESKLNKQKEKSNKSELTKEEEKILSKNLEWKQKYEERIKKYKESIEEVNKNYPSKEELIKMGYRQHRRYSNIWLTNEDKIWFEIDRKGSGVKRKIIPAHIGDVAVDERGRKVVELPDGRIFCYDRLLRGFN